MAALRTKEKVIGRVHTRSESATDHSKLKSNVFGTQIKHRDTSDASPRIFLILSLKNLILNTLANGSLPLATNHRDDVVIVLLCTPDRLSTALVCEILVCISDDAHSADSSTTVYMMAVYSTAALTLPQHKSLYRSATAQVNT